MHRVEICSCGARIRFGRTREGKKMPLDELPVADGNVVLHDLPGEGVVAVVLKKGEAVDPLKARYQAHWANCPHHKRYRGRK